MAEGQALRSHGNPHEGEVPTPACPRLPVSILSWSSRRGEDERGLELNSFQTSGNSPSQGHERCAVGILGSGTVESAIARRLTSPDSISILPLTHICDRRTREKRARQPASVQHVVKPEAFRKTCLSGGPIRQVAPAECDAATGSRGALALPLFVPAASVLARTHGPENAAVIAGAYGGELTMTGTGAGPGAITVSVWGDPAVVSRGRAAIAPTPVLAEPGEIQGLLDPSLAEAV